MGSVSSPAKPGIHPFSRIRPNLPYFFNYTGLHWQAQRVNVGVNTPFKFQKIKNNHRETQAVTEENEIK